ncbi:FAD-dependent 5-carboxymethylaminomethyl-2-thiouridine(34) oxidoreductase MnmC [Moraxella sp. ZY200743]|uniref:FAD-dependent 5-carboxymethylaminomethyl-2-thiouridine(34) oxidoreductase MnmC n=1 Tax=Moraxella sp. ZY200743 TaxID=2911970 RepID=UPI003D7C7700
MNQINNAVIEWRLDHLGNTVPTSQKFDDVYFSHAGGLDESHYVFIEGNDLPHRLTQLNDNHIFVVAETGFGTGLNFLALYKLWRTLKHQGRLAKKARLHFISTEKFPLSHADLQKALGSWLHDDTIAVFVSRLLDCYPVPLAGCHRMNIADDIMLDLWLGEALDSFHAIYRYQKTLHPNTSKVDAWFLDGFAPSKNSDLWSDELFELIRKLSSPNATIATFTAAGFVRRGLSAVGFDVQKKQGFGRKREMITGKLHCNDKVMTTFPKHIAIIGAGIAGLCSAWALSKRGIKVSLYDKISPISGASGNPRALFAPKLSLIEQASHHLSTISFLYAVRFYQSLNTKDGIYEPLGVVDFLLPTQKSVDKLQALINPYPHDLIHQIDAIYPNQKIHTFIPKAGLINPAKLAQAVLSEPLISWQQADIKHISCDEKQVVLHGNDQTFVADEVVISAGFESHLLHEQLFNPRKIRGQISWLSVNTDTFAKLPKNPIKYDGYCAKFTDDGGNYFLMGASFVRNETHTAIMPDEHKFNIDKLTQSLPNIASTLGIGNNAITQQLQGRASIRAQTPDYHPIIGKVSDRIYAMYGMGSKGFTFSPLCGEIIAGMVCDEILPACDHFIKKISPQRTRLLTPLTDNSA